MRGVAESSNDLKSKAGGVDPPPSELVDRLNSLPAEDLRNKLKEGMRVKVRFVEEIDGPYGGGSKANSKGGNTQGKGGNGKKGVKRREIKWYPGAIAKILSGGRKVRIGYDDGTEETAGFPDGDIFVEGLGELLGLGGEAKKAGATGNGAAEGAAEDGANASPESPVGGAAEAEPCEELGAGWTKKVVPRKNASGRWGNAKSDTFYFGPGGTKFKSMSEARRHLDEGVMGSNGRDEGGAGGVGAVEGVAGGGGGKQPAPASAPGEKGIGGDNAAVADAGEEKGASTGKEGSASSSAIGAQPGEISNDKPQSSGPPDEPKPPQCAPFNRALKAALDSYHHSHTLVKIQNDPKGPMPPPFLSHDEECAVKTALAFVMARKRVQGRETKRVETEGEGGTSSFLGVGGGGRQNVLGGGGRPSSSLLGGLLSAPRRSMATVASGTGSGLATDRKLHHVRDVLRLAVSAALPLYRGALEGKKDASDSEGGTGGAGRRPCAVYDYEAAVQPASHDGENEGSDRGHAALDGLCRHAVERLAGLLREEALRAKNSRRSAVPEKARGGEEEIDENRSNGNGSSSDKGREGQNEKLSFEKGQTSTGRGVGSCSVRDAIARLVQDDLLGKAFSYGAESSSASSKRGRSQSNNARESAERRIERGMAVCHVLHRLLFVDESCCLGTEVVAAICSVLGDLYSNQYRGGTGSNDDGSERGSANGIDGESRSASHASSRSSEELRKSQSEKHQLIPARWTVGSGSYVHDRHERRRQAVDVLSQRSGAKRVHPHEEDEQQNSLSSNAALPLPRIGDVLAVNLLRLLEGAAAIRLHRRQQRARGGRGDRERALDRAASAAAAEVLGEIRAGFVGEGREVLLPVQAEDAAAFYYSEKRALEGVTGGKGKGVMLLPGAKMMLRRHLFGLTSKLALYEQA